MRDPNTSDLNTNGPFHGEAGRTWMERLLTSEENQDLFKEALKFVPFADEAVPAKLPCGSGQQNLGQQPPPMPVGEYP